MVLKVTLALCTVLFLNIILLKYLDTTFDVDFLVSVGTGLVSNIIGLIIAVFAVDQIIRSRRRASFKTLNERQSQTVAYTTNKFLLSLLQELKLVEDDATYISAARIGCKLGVTNKILSDIGLDFVVQDMKSYLQSGLFGSAVINLAKSENYSADLIKFRDIFENGFEKARQESDKIKPYPVPWVHKLFTEDLPEVTAIFAVVQSIEAELLKHRSLELTNELRLVLREALLVDIVNRLQKVLIKLISLSEQARKNKIFDLID